MWTLFLKNWKALAIVAGALFVMWLWGEYKYFRLESIRQTENNNSQRKFDSLHYAEQVLSKDEINDYLEYQNKDLRDKIKADGIDKDRLMSIISNNYKYANQDSKSYDMSPLIQAINEKREMSQPRKDTTKCMTVEGNVEFKDNKLTVNVTNREFHNKSDGIVYWQRREWKLLWFKTRLFGRKEFTAKQYDECGQSEVMKIEKKK